jgi:hypothetical protein
MNVWVVILGWLMLQFSHEDNQAAGYLYLQDTWPCAHMIRCDMGFGYIGSFSNLLLVVSGNDLNSRRTQEL